jgi:hypothetical protein
MAEVKKGGLLAAFKPFYEKRNVGNKLPADMQPGILLGILHA